MLGKDRARQLHSDGRNFHSSCPPRLNGQHSTVLRAPLCPSRSDRACVSAARSSSGLSVLAGAVCNEYRHQATDSSFPSASGEDVLNA